ncbi:MAG TPA: hypothetical protein VH858_01055, partial [Hyphomicrobiales bacterium]
MQARALTLIRWLGSAAVIAAVGLGLAFEAAALPFLADPAKAAEISELLVVAIISGVILAAAGAAVIFLRAASRARLAETRSAEAVKALRQELEVAQSIVMAEPQVLVAFEADGAPRLVNHLLDS